MSLLVRWFAPVALAAGLGGTAAFAPATAHADDELVRVIVDAADVILRGGDPYYRDGRHGYSDRLVVERDRHGRPVYYRNVARSGNGHHRHRRSGPPAHAPAHGYRASYGHRDRGATRCDKRGRCTVQYYDPRFDRDHRGRRR
ncbi:hypothetical protein [Luteimonas abyssi]|uniref:hypothetical protein n=1 Tax=Luteimonas abyssi TaxID=1247514 RepID=UPI000737B8CA|nr:hypothetical protein [Luteimonas abyssi]